MTNVLYFLIQKALRDGNVKGIKLNRSCPTLTHLLFVDDPIFFLDGTMKECQNMANLLNQYCYASAKQLI